MAGDTRVGAPLVRPATKASVLPLVSPATRFDADDRKPTHDGPLTSAFANEPSIDGAHDGPLAGAPPRPREISTVRSGAQGEPLLPKVPPRSTAKTSFWPFVSPETRSDASDSNAIARA